MNLELKSVMTKITGINLRKEGTDEDRVTGADISVEFSCGPEIFTYMAVDKPPGIKWEKLFWKDDGTARVYQFKQIESSAEYVRHKIRLGSAQFVSDVIKKIKMIVDDNKTVRVKMQVSFIPNETQVVQLANMIGTQRRMTVSPTQSDLAAPEEEEKTEE